MDAGDRLAQQIEALRQLLAGVEPASLRAGIWPTPRAATRYCRDRRPRPLYLAGTNAPAGC